MAGKIIIELTTTSSENGSEMPDLGHDLYWLMREIPRLIFHDPDGGERSIADIYEITRVTTEAK